MSSYKIQPGVVLTSVCGEHMLVATRLARGKCPYVKQLNSTGAFYWSLLEQGKDLEEMVAIASEAYGVDGERIRPGLEKYIEGLRSGGYLLPEDAL